MTPRQLHALEWAVDGMALCLENENDLFVDKDELIETQGRYAKLTDARRALAAAWAEHRAAGIEARTKRPRRALQRVGLRQGVDGADSKG